jgi:hypothetical protein
MNRYLRCTGLRVVGLMALVCLAGCTDTPKGLSSPSPGYGVHGAADPRFHLTPDQRARVRPDFDASALEHLLSMIPPAGRDTLFAFFVRRPAGQPSPILVDMGDPKLQEALDAVYAPRYEKMTDAELRDLTDAVNHGATEIPGRITVMRRRGLLPRSPEQKSDGEP